MGCDIVEVQLSEGEYANLRSAQTSLCCSIKRLGLSMRTHIYQGHLYIRKVNPSIPVVFMGGDSPYKTTGGEGGRN